MWEVTLIVLMLAAPKPVSIEQDRWLGADKVKHFAMSYAVSSFAFAGSRPLLDHDASTGVAISAGISAAILKEVYDRKHGGLFSARDLLWDAAGIAVGYVVMKQVR